MVWTCRQCAKDGTCVQCNTCFKASDHTDHEVYFHRAVASGGCCDCGDPEAWAVSGNCSKHSGNLDYDADPSDTIPSTLKRGMRNVLRGALGVAVSFSTGVVRAYIELIEICYGYLSMPWLSYRGLLSIGVLESQHRSSSTISLATY